MHWKLPVLGFRIGDVAYITDANYIAPSEIAKIHGCRILVVNALHGGASHPSHFTLAQALDVAEQSAADRVYLTHISHQMGLHGQVERKLPAKVRLAYDGLIIENDEL
jgi:phosphoribosyl 1,2-cyclic phosphate phosphodiesterase